MLLLDDSNMLNFQVPPEGFDYSRPELKNNTTYPLPSMVYRLESGVGNPSFMTPTADPSSGWRFRPVIIENNIGWYDNNYVPSVSPPQDLFAATSWFQGSLGTVAKYSACATEKTESDGTKSAIVATVCTGPGPTTPTRGVNSLASAKDSNIVGTNVFANSSLLETCSGFACYVTDISGHEYLYVNNRAGIEMKRSTGTNTRTFAMTGGRFVLYGKQLVLPAGVYEEEYLRWLVYFATPTERSQMPGTGRDILRKATIKIIQENPKIEFGLSTQTGTVAASPSADWDLQDQFFVTAGYPFAFENLIWVEAGTSHSLITSLLYYVGSFWAHPLSLSHNEILNYYAGGPSNSIDGLTYSGAVNDACKSYSILVVSDNTFFYDPPTTLNGEWVNDFDNDHAEATPTSQFCEPYDAVASGSSKSSCWDFADDAAYWASSLHDFNTSLAGQQSVKTFAINLDFWKKFGSKFTSAKIDLLGRMAEKGGTGSPYLVNQVSGVKAALDSVIDVIVTSPTSSASSSLSESIGEDGRIYRPRLSADLWTGTVDVYGINKSTQALEFKFDVASVLRDRNLVEEPRSIYVGIDTGFDGTTDSISLLTEATAPQLKGALFRKFVEIPAQRDFLMDPLKDYLNDDTAKTLVRYLQGKHVAGLRRRDRNADGSTADLGDIVNSSPVEVRAQNGDFRRYSGYVNFIKERAGQPPILLVGANDGMLHAFSTTDGKELWAYIPAPLVPELELLTRKDYNTASRRSYVDGLVTVTDAYVGGSWRTLAMFGLRTGGGSYSVLDITDRRTPKLLFEVDTHQELGGSWSAPAIVIAGGAQNTKDPSAVSWYMAVATGEPNTLNTFVKPMNNNSTKIGIVELQDSITPSKAFLTMESSVPVASRASSVLSVQTDVDIQTDRLYAGTEAGNVFRVNIVGAPGSWPVTKMFSGSASRPIVAKPASALVSSRFVAESDLEPGSTSQYSAGIFFGTGRYDSKSDTSLIDAASQRIYGLFDPINPDNDTFENALSNVTESSLQLQSATSFDVKRGNDGVFRLKETKKGFYIPLGSSLSGANSGSGFLDPVGMVLDSPANLRGMLLFSTFLPSKQSCDYGGYSFLNALHAQTGGGSIIDYYTKSHAFLNGGIPDLNLDEKRDSVDLSLGAEKGVIEPILDVKIASSDLSSSKPYTHNGKIEEDDVRLHSMTGGVIAAVSSIGEKGIAMKPGVFISGGKILVSTSSGFSPIALGKPVTPSDNPTTFPDPAESTVTPPDSVPVRIYNLPIKTLSIFERTRD